MTMLERQELFCHGCNRYVQFDIDVLLNGNHVLTCPVCGHEHCRVVKDGIITDDRWDSTNGPTYNIVTATTSSVSSWDMYTNARTATSSASSIFLYSSWMNATNS